MTAHATAGLLGGADVALPARDQLLDPEAMRRVFAATLGLSGPLPVASVVRVRAKYRPGESLRVLYRISVDDQEYLISARMRHAGAQALYDEARVREIPCEPLRGVCLDPGLQTVFWTYPNDRALPPSGITANAASWLAQHSDDRSIAIEMAGYAPERSVVLRAVERSSGRVLAYVKSFAPGGLAASRARLEALTEANADSDAPVRVPRLLAADAEGEQLVIEALAGSPLARLAEQDWEVAFFSLGDAMARLHRLPPPAWLPESDPFADDTLIAGAGVIAAVRPELAVRAQALCAKLANRRPAAEPLVWLHGDLNSRNWLAQDGRVALFDFDQSARGAAGADLGDVLAWMRTRTLLGAWSPAREHVLVSALLAGYARHRPAPPREVRLWCRSAALFVHRGVRSIARVRERHLAMLPSILQAAEADLTALERGDRHES